MSEYFQCGHCKGVFKKNWTDEEMMAESQNLFGEIPKPHREVICDDCFKEFMEGYQRN